MKRTNDQRHAVAKRNALYAALNRQTARDLKRYMAQNTTRNGKRQSTLVFQGGSTAFSDARWSNGMTYLTFERDGYQETIPMDRSEAADFFSSPSLGKAYNDDYR